MNMHMRKCFTTINTNTTPIINTNTGRTTRLANRTLILTDMPRYGTPTPITPTSIIAIHITRGESMQTGVF